MSLSSKEHDTQMEHESEKGAHALETLASNRVAVSEEDNKRILRLTDWYILPVLMWVYYLQSLDKTVIGYAAVFGLKTNTNLQGNDYSSISASGYIAQFFVQPVAAYLLVRVPVRPFMAIIVFCWGASQFGMAFSPNFGSLYATRFLLGFFEAACLPLFTLVTVSWYRRSEQPFRIAYWYSMNGVVNITAAPLVWGLGHIATTRLYSYQIIFLVTSTITMITGPCLYWLANNSVAEAKFLSPEDRLKGVERLRANQTGAAQSTFKWYQVRELIFELKTWIFLFLAIALNTGASVTSAFGPLILQGLVGFDSYTTVLLNIPFGALQLVVILLASWLAYRYSLKGVMLIAIALPVVLGTGLLFGISHTKANTAPLLVGYYLLSFIFAGNPLLVGWMSANTAGQSKKAAMICGYNAASSVGNVIGPYLFQAADSPAYLPGLKAVLAIFCIFIGLTAFQIFWISRLNAGKERQRVANGKPAVLGVDASMVKKFDNLDDSGEFGSQGFLDLTDQENDEFVYLL